MPTIPRVTRVRCPEAARLWALIDSAIATHDPGAIRLAVEAYYWHIFGCFACECARVEVDHA